MRNPDSWKPTKFVRVNGRLKASRDPRQVGASSRMIADRAALAYDRVLRAHARGTLLDMGCGHAPLFETYRPFVKDAVCIDWSNSLHSSPHLDITADLNRPIPLRDRSFDTILLTDVLEHIVEPRLLVFEISRLLRPGGKLIGGVPFLYWIHEGPWDYHRFTLFALRRIFSDADLAPVEISPYGGLPEVLIDLTSKGGVTLFPRLSKPIGVAQSLASFVLETKFFRKLSTATSGEFPIGYVFVAEKSRG